jgi:assimilatory nitrate reductase catalytic subunit
LTGIVLAKPLLGRDLPAAERVTLLAGVSVTGAAPAGRMVCACFSVSEDRIIAAIRDNGLDSPARIGAALKAGTNCGSCLPEINKLIGAQAPSVVS